jgi:hypothetical protein
MGKPDASLYGIKLIHELSLMIPLVSFATGCAKAAEGVSDNGRQTQRQNRVTQHQVGDSVVIGSDAPGYLSPHIRFTIESIDEVSGAAHVRLKAVSAQEGRIAYLRTQHYALSGSVPAPGSVTVRVGEQGQRLPGLAVCDKERRNLPPIGLRLRDNFGNEYELASVEPSQPFFQALYPGETRSITATFLGPIVPQATSLTFQFVESFDKIHEWRKVR